MPDDALNPWGRIWQRWAEVLQEEAQRSTAELLRDAFGPDRLMQFIRSMNVDPWQLPHLAGQQTGFDAYKVLGLDRSAGDAEVKTRYRDLLRKLHPDTAGVEGTELLLQLVMAAYKQIARERGWN